MPYLEAERLLPQKLPLYGYMLIAYKYQYCLKEFELRHNCLVKGPAEVISRYKKVFKTFTKVRTMTEAFRIEGVNRGTVKMTAAIAELHIVDPVAFNTLKFDPATETLQSFAKRCAMHITPEKKSIIEDMKAKCQLLPLLMKY